MSLNWTALYGVLGVAVLMFPAMVSGDKKPESNAPSLNAVDPLTKRKLGTPSRFERNLLKYTNLARKQQDKPPLVAVSHLTVIAQQHAINMAKQQKMAHELDGKSAVDRLKSVSYRFKAYGENVSMGYPNERATIEGWLKSPPHKENLLDEKGLGFTQIGIGAHRDVNGRWYCCQVFAKPAPRQNYE